MSTLFNNNNAENGFRLRYLEVFNWGTFDSKVYCLQTNGKTSLLTGANGSGKTTLVDAMLTILVPGNKRYYNQSSGADLKKERDENSYFWGHFGKTYLEAEEKSQTEQLRHKKDNPYSVLLACFQNAGMLHSVTLVQVRWYTSAGLRKVFIVAPHQLNISEHFGKGHFDVKGEWRKKLVRQFPKTDVFDSFKDYAARFSDLFGLKEKALSLFNQTVGIKVLGDLTQFVRNHMLEEPDAEDQFKALYDHYNDLLISHKAIQKDEKQLELLDPVVKNNELLTELRKKKATLEFIEGQMPHYLSNIEFGLLDKHINQLEIDIEFVKKETESIATSIAQFEDEKENLIGQKAALNIDHQITLLKKDINSETEKLEVKKSNCQQYETLASKINLNTDLDESIFNENFRKINQLEHSLQGELDILADKRARIKIEMEKRELDINVLQEEITSLINRKNKIPEDLIRVRKRLLELLDTGEQELPFAGELIKIKDDELSWEDSIEKVLHGFAMQLLVPEKFSKAVNQFINTNDLQTKLVYQKIDRRASYSLTRWPTEDEALINKIEFKEGTIYKEWLENHLLDRYNYLCTDDLDIFYDCSKAITSNGLIRNINRHEKDDSKNWNKSKYRLGWDPRETILFLQNEKSQLIKKQESSRSMLNEISPMISGINTKMQVVRTLIVVKSFDEINWQQHAEKINHLNGQITDLLQTSDAYKTISDQLSNVETSLSDKNNEKEKCIRKSERLIKDYNDKNARKLKIDFEQLTEDGIEAINAFIDSVSIINKIPETLDQLDRLTIELGTKFKRAASNANTELGDLEMKTNSLIAAFVYPGEKITSQFTDWSGDVLNIAPSISSLPEIVDLYNTIRNQRIVEHKRRFREYMDKSMLDALTNYKTWLNNEVEKIEEIIGELNIPLKRITFNRNPDTYLQLEFRSTREQEIRLFRERLAATIPNALEFATKKDETYRNEIFERIRNLITELQKEELWRKRVTDVRNWLFFSAREYTVAENRAGQFHENTASYSGGQKAQFTYAILGAAIAHQFGIFQTGKQHKSLRFITVDEAFSKLDPEKSQFLMEFCAQLNLQLLVVTPLDKINIAEPYIDAVHFVEIKNKRNSVLYNLTMEEYHEKKEMFKQLAESSQ
jgi:uncharacterized protein YPO0396